MSLRLMRPEIVGPIQILHDDGVRTCENDTGILGFSLLVCVILLAVFFRMDEDGIEKLPAKYCWLIVLGSLCVGLLQ
jgi:hypothetical protein